MPDRDFRLYTETYDAMIERHLREGESNLNPPGWSPLEDEAFAELEKRLELEASYTPADDLHRPPSSAVQHPPALPCRDIPALPVASPEVTGTRAELKDAA